MKKLIALFTILISQLAISQFADPVISDLLVQGNVNLYELTKYDKAGKRKSLLNKYL